MEEDRTVHYLQAAHFGKSEIERAEQSNSNRWAWGLQIRSARILWADIKPYLFRVAGKRLSLRCDHGRVACKWSKAFNPNWYVNQEGLRRCRDGDIGSDSFLELDKNNFRIGREKLISIEFDNAPKWGMGVVPYSGRLRFKFSDGHSREFILLGYQDGEKLKQSLVECGFGK